MKSQSLEIVKAVCYALRKTMLKYSTLLNYGPGKKLSEINNCLIVIKIF